MRIRAKWIDGEIVCLVAAADNADERERLNKFYSQNLLKDLSELNGKQVHPYERAKPHLNKIASEQAPEAIDRRKEGARKSRATRRKNKEAQSQSE